MKYDGEPDTSEQARPTGQEPAPAAPRLHKPAAGEPAKDTNQAERAAMHPEGHDLEWHYYHGAWSG